MRSSVGRGTPPRNTDCSLEGARWRYSSVDWEVFFREQGLLCLCVLRLRVRVV